MTKFARFSTENSASSCHSAQNMHDRDQEPSPGLDFH